MGWGAVASQLCAKTAPVRSEAPRVVEPAAPSHACNTACDADQCSESECWEEVDALHSESEAECSQSDRLWWAETLQDLTKELGIPLPPPRDSPVSLVSCCSGAFSEGVVFEDGSHLPSDIIAVLVH